MIVLIDQNEQATNPSIVTGLQEIYPGATITQLMVGDINIVAPQGLLAIERKTPSDLLSSIEDGRLFDQAERMLKHATFASFVIHGSLLYDRNDYVIADGQSRKWQGVSVRAALRTCQLAGCLVEIVPKGKYIETIGEVVATVSKESHVHSRKPAITLETLDLRVQWLSMIPGVGPKRAKEWLDWVNNGSDRSDRLCDVLSYGSLFSSLSSTTLPHGFGPKTAQSIRDFLQLEYGEYLEVIGEINE